MNPLSPMWTPPKDFSTLYHIKTFSNQNTKNNFQNLNKHTQEYCGGRKFTFQKIVNEIHCYTKNQVPKKNQVECI